MSIKARTKTVKTRPCTECGMNYCNHIQHPNQAELQELSMDGQPRLDGKKFDEGKPKLSFVARSLLVAIAYIMEPGAVKYGRDNWRGGMNWSRHYDALLRHLTAWWEGENHDIESKKSHLWHAACELMFLIEYETKELGKDDRSK